MVSTITNYYNAGFIIFDHLLKNILLVKGFLGWGLPKGYYEECDKTYFETAIREIKEELGIDIEDSNVFDISSSYSLLSYNKETKIYDWGIKPKGFIKRNIIFYAAKINSNTKFKLQKDEIIQVEWIPLNNISYIINTNNYSKYEKKKLINSINSIKKNIITI
jgi:8-oxo-dGTP pyrophosphatase MutT (NUDIX family)